MHSKCFKDIFSRIPIDQFSQIYQLTGFEAVLVTSEKRLLQPCNFLLENKKSFFLHDDITKVMHVRLLFLFCVYYLWIYLVTEIDFYKKISKILYKVLGILIMCHLKSSSRTKNGNFCILTFYIKLNIPQAYRKKNVLVP